MQLSTDPIRATMRTHRGLQASEPLPTCKKRMAHSSDKGGLRLSPLGRASQMRSRGQAGVSLSGDIEIRGSLSQILECVGQGPAAFL